jgi:hypothetical protein
MASVSSKFIPSHSVSESRTFVPKPRIRHHISIHNLREIIGQDAEGVMVYGVDSCATLLVKKAIQHSLISEPQMTPLSTTKNSPKSVRKVYDWTTGDPYVDCTSPDGHTVIPQITYSSIPDDQHRTISRKCKTGITNLVVYNTFQKSLNNRSQIIPTIFCIKAKRINPINNPNWSINGDTVLSKRPKYNDKVTMKEVRRVAKLCFNSSIDPRVTKVAQETIFFVEVIEHLDKSIRTNTDHYTYTLSKINPPWGNTKPSIDAFKTGLQKRASERETEDPLYRVLARLPETTCDQILENENTFLKSEIAKTNPDELTLLEKEDFDKAFNWGTIINSNRTFSCFGGRTLLQAFIDRLNDHVKTPCFRRQINDYVHKTLDEPTLSTEEQTVVPSSSS